MRLVAGVTTVALSGLAAAASQPAFGDAYLLQAASSPWRSFAETPSIPKEVVRHILLQRMLTQQHQDDLRDLRDIPNPIDIETAVSLIARYGKARPPLFASSTEINVSQLVVFLEGVTPEQAAQLQQHLGQYAAFTISDPPSSTANNHLMSVFRDLGVAPPEQCELSAVINPFETECWAGSSSVVKYDVRKSPETLDSLLNNLSRLEKFVGDGDLEVLLLALPESSRNSKLNRWSSSAGAGLSDLRHRRDLETVLSDHEPAGTEAVDPPVAGGGSTGGVATQRARAPTQCFTSFNTCMNQTNNCSGHGECVNKYATGGNSSATDSDSGSAPSCFACACKASVVHRGEGDRSKGRKTVHWGGSMCQKEDVSVPFWLIAGFTVTMVGAVSFAIGLLFNVGEQTLPGVIGAGVSRSK